MERTLASLDFADSELTAVDSAHSPLLEPLKDDPVRPEPEQPTSASHPTVEAKTTTDSSNLPARNRNADEKDVYRPATTTDTHMVEAPLLICPHWLSAPLLNWGWQRCGHDGSHGRFVHEEIPGVPAEALECAFYRQRGKCRKHRCPLEHRPTLHGLAAELPPRSAGNRQSRERASSAARSRTARR